MNFTSAASLIALLDEPKTELKVFALHQLNNIVNEFWHEISEVIEKLEILQEDKSFEQNKLAGLLVSKIYFHLGSFENSLTYALSADELFDINSRTEYVETILGKCIDFYIEQRHAIVDGSSDEPVTPKLENIINSLFRRCFNDGQYQQALGMALDSRRLDIVEYAIIQSNQVPDMLSYAFQVATNFIQNRAFKNKVLRLLVNMYSNLSKPDYVSMCQCLIILDDPLTVRNILSMLIRSCEENELLGYQIAFDLYESGTQKFLTFITDAFLPSPEVIFSDDDEEFQHKLEKMRYILSGRTSADLYSQFLMRCNKTDNVILNKTKENSRKIICFTGTVIANGFMRCGTADDSFLIVHSQWMGKMTNWAKTTAAASLGVIYQGQIIKSIEILLSYVPSNYSQRASKYTKCGILYGLGLIHANHGGEIIDYLLDELKVCQTEEERHGGCLGLGLTAMGSNRQDLYDQLKFELYHDEACTGEAAGIAMGLIMLGSNNTSAIEDMVSYAQESQHEKILRGLSVGIAFITYGRLDQADSLIYRLIESGDAILRRTAVYTMIMAYCGTGNTTIIRLLLHAAVSDVNDDVRRAAVTGLGFILFKTPEEFPNIVSLLIKSYNPHVRYGAAMALGIACAGTGMADALVLLEHIIEYDEVNFVRQGAFIASAMILMQQIEETCPKVNYFRKSYADVISNRYQSEIVKFGAILAQGIIDAGGRNLTLALQTRTGNNNVLAVVGTFLFTQYWYWFPLAHCLALAFIPTCIIAVNPEFNIPKLWFKSDAKPSLFAYPPSFEANRKEKMAKIRIAILSVTKRKEKKLKTPDQTMDVSEEEEEKNKMKIETKEKKLNPTFEMLNNPARVLKKQLPFMSFNDTNRYIPVRDVSNGGIIILRDLTPYTKANYVDAVDPSIIARVASSEPKPPEDFEWLED